ncbi:MAG: kinase [Candidatus Brennerbacteria bacterium]|nr:kinase [Candidatus Brennerbacteria bacterium]
MILTRTPYRISFFGGGTDYPAWFENFGTGAVLSTTIDKYCYLACRFLPPFFEHKSRIVWSKIEVVNHHDDIEHPTAREALKLLDVKDGVEIHHYGDLPARSGMGSSSAFAVGLLHALNVLHGRPVTKKQLAMDSIHIEQERLGHSVGCQDQTAAAYGGFNRITFGGSEKINVRPVTASPETKEVLQERLLMFFTGLSRDAFEVAEQQVRVTGQKKEELTKMLSLVDQAEKILQETPHHIDEFGRLLHETWTLKRSLTDVISNSRIDDIYERARAAGALGGKLLGAGGGGFLLLYVKPEEQETVKSALKDLLHVPFSFENEGTKLIYQDGS